MATIERFEDIEAWKDARELTKLIYETWNSGDFSRDFGLRDQIRRASVSVMSNIAEGFERGGDNEFHHYLSLAKGSNGEVRSQLYVAFDAHFITQDIFQSLYTRSEVIGKPLSALMTYLRRSDLRGNKFKP